MPPFLSTPNFINPSLLLEKFKPPPFLREFFETHISPLYKGSGDCQRRESISKKPDGVKTKLRLSKFSNGDFTNQFIVHVTPQLGMAKVFVYSISSPVQGEWPSWLQ